MHKHLSNCRFAAAESFNLRLICFRHTDLWVSRKASTLRPTRGPRCDGKAAAWKWLHAAGLILRRRWPNMSNEQPHTLVAYYLPRFSSSTGAHCGLARCMQMQAAQHMVVRCRCVAEPALRMWHALRLCAWPICARRGTRHNGFVNYRQGLHETTQDGWHVVPVDCRPSICDPHDVQHHIFCRYWSVHHSAGSGSKK